MNTGFELMAIKASAKSLRLMILMLFLGCTASAQDAGKQHLLGTWKFVAYHFGDGISVGPREARKLLGKKVRYTSSGASFGTYVCAQAVYKTKRLSDAEFFRDDRTSLKSIGIKGTEINTIDVECDGKHWIAPGSFLLKMPNGQMQTIWDGVFYYLKKVR